MFVGPKILLIAIQLFCRQPDDMEQNSISLEPKVFETKHYKQRAYFRAILHG